MWTPVVEMLPCTREAGGSGRVGVSRRTDRSPRGWSKCIREHAGPPQDVTGVWLDGIDLRAYRTKHKEHGVQRRVSAEQRERDSPACAETDSLAGRWFQVRPNPVPRAVSRGQQSVCNSRSGPGEGPLSAQGGSRDGNDRKSASPLCVGCCQTSLRASGDSTCMCGATTGRLSACVTCDGRHASRPSGQSFEEQQRLPACRPGPSGAAAVRVVPSG